jgi:hypothetical protein
MRFNGCRCKACQTIAISAASLIFASYVYPTAYGDECWDQPQVRLYCQAFVPEQPQPIAIMGPFIGCELAL